MAKPKETAKTQKKETYSQSLLRRLADPLDIVKEDVSKHQILKKAN